jgi:hypothetical protein
MQHRLAGLGVMGRRGWRRRSVAAEQTHALDVRERAVGERERALDTWERALLEREPRVGLPVGAFGSEAGEPAHTAAALVVATELRNLMIDTGDDLVTVARGIGLDPEWARRLLAGHIRDVDLAHLRQVCAGLGCSAAELFGADVARALEHRDLRTGGSA